MRTLRASSWKGLRGSLLSLAVLVAFTAAVTLVFWPGEADPDTLGEWTGALTGGYTDWHTPILSALWRSLVLAGAPSPGWVLAGGILTLLVGIYLLLRVRLGRPASVLLACLVLAFPPVLGWAVHVGRDAWFAAFLLCAFGVLCRSLRAQGRGRVALLAVAVLLGALAAASRQNAFPALLVLFAAIAVVAWPAGRRRPWYGVAAVAVLATGAVIGVEAAVVAVVLHARPTHPDQVVLDYDLAALSRIEGRVLFPPDIYPKQDLAWLQANSNTEQADSLEFGPDRVVAMPVDGARYDLLRSTWIKAVTGHPLSYLDDRLHFALRLFGFTGEPALVFQVNPLDPAAGAPLHPGLDQHAVDYLAAFTGTGRPDSGTLIHRAWIYALLLLAAIALWLRRGVEPALRAVAACGVACLLYAAGTVFAAPSTYYRYLYVVIVAGTVAAVLLVASAVPAVRRRLAGRRS